MKTITLLALALGLCSCSTPQNPEWKISYMEWDDPLLPGKAAGGRMEGSGLYAEDGFEPMVSVVRWETRIGSR